MGGSVSERRLTRSWGLLSYLLKHLHSVFFPIYTTSINLFFWRHVYIILCFTYLLTYYLYAIKLPRWTCTIQWFLYRVVSPSPQSEFRNFYYLPPKNCLPIGSQSPISLPQPWVATNSLSLSCLLFYTFHTSRIINLWLTSFIAIMFLRSFAL